MSWHILTITITLAMAITITMVRVECAGANQVVAHLENNEKSNNNSCDNNNLAIKIPVAIAIESMVITRPMTTLV